MTARIFFFSWLISVLINRITSSKPNIMSAVAEVEVGGNTKKLLLDAFTELDEEEYSDDYDENYSGEDYNSEEEFHQDLESRSLDLGAYGSGNITQQYNRQRRFIESASLETVAGPRIIPGTQPVIQPTQTTENSDSTKVATPADSAPAVPTPAAAPEPEISKNEVLSRVPRINAQGPKTSHNKSVDDPANQLAKYAARINLGGAEEMIQSTKGKGKTQSTTATADRSNRATTEQVLDPRTRMILFKMINRGIVYEINGCISTGKEANVYHAQTEEGAHRAIKIYKTSILVFKDRDRYVTGEFRFRNGYSRHNPRKMVKLWAEKEFRNLKRIYQSDIPVPKPLHLHLHVLVMEFLGDKKGWASPRLRDAVIEPELFPGLYLQLISYMRILYQQCRLVHADLSEYNILYHKKKLWMIDVSQSVEHDHPSSLEFLRMDIKNVSDYFRRQGVEVFSERRTFRFITMSTLDPEHFPSAVVPAPYPEKSDYLVEVLEGLPKEEETESSAADDAVFRSVYIPQNLEQVYDVERDVERVNRGEAADLIYGEMVVTKNDKKVEEVSESSEAEGSDDEEEGTGSDKEEEDDDEWKEKSGADRKFTDRESNKDRKKQVKLEAKEKRQKKIKKHVKKKLISNSTKKKK